MELCHEPMHDLTILAKHSGHRAISLQFGFRYALARCTALYKLGQAHYQQKRSQHAIHYFDQALDICQDESTQPLQDIQVEASVVAAQWRERLVQDPNSSQLTNICVF